MDKEDSNASVARVNRWRPLESVVLFVYAVLLAIGVHWHEPWADEAQAWLLARDMGWLQMMSHGVRYEGSPGLWHSVLWVLIKLHLSFTQMRWIAAAFAMCGTVVLFRFARFPRVLRMLLPFTFFLAYQDAVVARSYVMFAALAFSAAALLDRQSKKPILLSVILGLLANLSVHGFLASLGLGLIMGKQLWRRGGAPREWAPALVLLGALWAAAISSALPPKDIDSNTGINVEQSIQQVKAVVGQQTASKPLRISLPGELVPLQLKSHHYTRAQSARRRVMRLLALITFPISSFVPLSLLAFLLVVLHGLKMSGDEIIGRSGLLPYLLMLTIFSSLYIAPRHAGTLFTVFVVTAWLTWPRTNESRLWGLALTSVLTLMCVHQMSWTLRAIWSDVHGAYAPGPMTASFVAKQPPNDRIAGFYYHSVGLLPYFKNSLYENQPRHAYWPWSTHVRINQSAPSELQRRPDVVVVSGFVRGDNGDITSDWIKQEPDESVDGQQISLGDLYQIVPYFEAHGYEETHRFCGHSWMRAGYSELLCDVVLQPVHR